MTIPDTHKYTPVAVPVSGDVGDENPLSEGLIAATPVNVPPSEGRPYLEVVAPATLPEGFTFDAEANGRTFPVTVPAGGVVEGQKFSVPFPDEFDGFSGVAIRGTTVPEGYWKDDLCACFRHGLCHPSLWNACCCPMVLVGQVMQRLKLTWCANQGGTAAQTNSTFRILLWTTIAFHIIRGVLQSLSGGYSFDISQSGQAQTMPASFYALTYTNSLLGFFYAIGIIILVCKTRRRIRDRYNIPEQSCRGCEDCCCAYWCTCCTVAQMARHTADYDTYAARCCSETGLPHSAPSIV